MSGGRETLCLQEALGLQMINKCGTLLRLGGIGTGFTQLGACMQIAWLLVFLGSLGCHARLVRLVVTQGNKANPFGAFCGFQEGAGLIEARRAGRGARTSRRQYGAQRSKALHTGEQKVHIRRRATS